MNQQPEMAPSARQNVTREEWDAARGELLERKARDVTRRDEYGGA
jgi:hypothetical protein